MIIGLNWFHCSGMVTNHVIIHKRQNKGICKMFMKKKQKDTLADVTIKAVHFMHENPAFRSGFVF